ncbi:MAG: hypothetical protein KDE14_04850 [Rhodobacteraceae bacterium]|nr:hypothetical protein [Paracoccaceae bacterium]
MSDIGDDDVDYTLDDAPIGGAMGLAIPACDPLLAELRAHHADDAARHQAPREWIRRDAAGVLTPTRAELKAWARMLDAASIGAAA